MGSRLRPLYDRLYIRVETLLLARDANRSNRAYAAGVSPIATLDEDYRSIVRPYWKQFKVRIPKKYSFRLYSSTDKGLADHVDPRYIPDTLWFDRIIPHYNNLIFAKALQDKCMLNLLFPDVRRPVTVVKNIAGVFYDDGLNLLTRAEAAARVPGHGRIIVKPSVSTGEGHNIRFFDSDTMTPAEAEAVFDQYGRNFVIQEKMAQHPDLARLNPDSLNSVRVITLLKDDRVHILTPILRVGGPKSEIDNISQGGFQGSILPDGHLAPRGFTHRNNCWEFSSEYPNGIRFADVVIPSYDRVISTAEKLASRMGHFRIIGWDLAVAPDGEVVLVEFNVIPEQNQETTGPTFGDLTDEVLADVFGRRS